MSLSAEELKEHLSFNYHLLQNATLDIELLKILSNRMIQFYQSSTLVYHSYQKSMLTLFETREQPSDRLLIANAALKLKEADNHLCYYETIHKLLKILYHRGKINFERDLDIISLITIDFIMYIRSNPIGRRCLLNDTTPYIYSILHKILQIFYLRTTTLAAATLEYQQQQQQHQQQNQFQQSSQVPPPLPPPTLPKAYKQYIDSIINMLSSSNRELGSFYLRIVSHCLSGQPSIAPYQIVIKLLKIFTMFNKSVHFITEYLRVITYFNQLFTTSSIVFEQYSNNNYNNLNLQQLQQHVNTTTTTTSTTSRGDDDSHRDINGDDDNTYRNSASTSSSMSSSTELFLHAKSPTIVLSRFYKLVLEIINTLLSLAEDSKAYLNTLLEIVGNDISLIAHRFNIQRHAPLFGEHLDIESIETLETLLSIYINIDSLRLSTNPSLEALSNAIHPHIVFSYFMEYICSYDHSMLLDLLISSESTHFLSYFLKYLHFIIMKPSSLDKFVGKFQRTNVPMVVDEVPSQSVFGHHSLSSSTSSLAATHLWDIDLDSSLDSSGNPSEVEIEYDFYLIGNCLYKLYQSISKSHEINSFPYNPSLLLARLRRVQEIFERINY